MGADRVPIDASTLAHAGAAARDATTHQGDGRDNDLPISRTRVRGSGGDSTAS